MEYSNSAILSENKGNILPTFAYSVLDNYITGEIVADESSALIGTSSGIYVVVGDEKNDNFLDLLMNKFRSRTVSNQRFTLFSLSENWDNKIMELIGTELKQLQRLSFKFNEKNFMKLSKTKLPDKFLLNKINEEALHENRRFNIPYIIKYWGTVENFTEKGFGFSVTQNNVNAGECVSIFSSLEFAEIDIITNEHFRGKGVAQCTSEAFILECLNRTLTPRWDCDIYNHASINLAKKLSFGNPERYSVFVRK
ncbi:GNAT family N-acetyltransferase [Paenibacillus urinalis]|uniref:GNAT family N-acetyltransferase n=1 Tax=Paenibacillus urinalis TaxID=521520 RepID=A0ABY7XD18_9BACL|nr:GNAT family N-acetyltransferase [Paenibacillus urinalis]WDH95466.1 GNAT family N-acetyltransferase [Paenibacillus urinalis]WDI03664.1 GNAT family N-acetyltransferase [Paenibacillus urinalis]